MKTKRLVGVMLLGTTLLLTFLASSKALEKSDFPQGTATPSETCGECHKAIYREFALGFGSDLDYKDITLKSSSDKRLSLPAQVSASATAHAFAGVDPFPIHARGSEEEGRSCNVCHFPEAFSLPDMESLEIAKPKPRPKGQEIGGLTCASCHLTPEGKIRGPYQVKAPHDTVMEPKMQTSEICAYCHSLGKRVEGKQTQSFLEWREDFHKKGLGKQHCQDCHMPRTMRKSAEDFDEPVRAIGRHLWTGGRSKQRLSSALSMVVVQKEARKKDLDFHIINIAAGHSVPTGSNRRGIYLIAEVINQAGKIVANQEWLFAPWYGNRPDDRAFLEEDKKRPDAAAAMQADAQGPHENILLAGEERILPWKPSLKSGTYTVQARLIYDLNRYNSRNFKQDQTELNRASLRMVVKE
ncbi:MAG: cytochrome c3 family protein [Deltaproteobacteria bacterium]|nr:cytochrome c3 family protein [Deltaproteobacteria bacterium]